MRAPSLGRGSERGAVVVLVALVLAVLLGFLGFVLNAGHATSVRGELQNASDAAALAAARELDGTPNGITQARSSAAGYSVLHDTDTTQTVNIDGTADVNFCNWSPVTQAVTWCLGYGVTPTTAPPPQPTLGATTQLQAVNAVQVRNGRETSRTNALPVWLSSFLGGTSSIDVSSRATAIGGGPLTVPPATPCLPFAYLICGFNSTCGQPIVYRNNNTQTAGFTLLNTGTVSANGINNFLANGTCPSTYVPAISMNNGNISAGNVWDQLRTLVGQDRAIPIVDAGASCQVSGSQLYPIVGFADIQLTGVYRNNQDNPVPDCGGITPCITGVVTCNNTSVSGAPGGLSLGLSTTRTRLVQ